MQTYFLRAISHAIFRKSFIDTSRLTTMAIRLHVKRDVSSMELPHVINSPTVRPICNTTTIIISIYFSAFWETWTCRNVTKRTDQFSYEPVANQSHHQSKSHSGYPSPNARHLCVRVWPVSGKVQGKRGRPQGLRGQGWNLGKGQRAFSPPVRGLGSPAGSLAGFGAVPAAQWYKAVYRGTRRPFEGWWPPGAKSAFIRWAGWTFVIAVVMTTAP